MITLKEYPDVNYFFIKEIGKLTIVPSLFAITDLQGVSLNYKYEWWYLSNPDEKNIVDGNILEFTDLIGPVNFRGIIEEKDAEHNILHTYYTDEILSYINHIKIKLQINSGYNDTELEYYKYKGYEDFSQQQGVKHNEDFKTEGIPGYSDKGKIIPVQSMIDSYKNRNQQGFDLASNDGNLNPVLDSEEDTNNAFTNYGLDIESTTDQNKFYKIQKYEHESFSNYNQTASLFRILKPIDDTLNYVYEQSNKKIEVEAGEDLQKHMLVYTTNKDWDENNEPIGLIALKASNVYYIKDDEINWQSWQEPRYAHGIVLNDAVKGETVNCQLSGVIKNYSFFWIDDEEYKYFGRPYGLGRNLYNYIGSHLYLSIEGKIGYENSYDSEPMIIRTNNEIMADMYKYNLYSGGSGTIVHSYSQIVGVSINKKDFILDIQPPVIKKILNPFCNNFNMRYK